MNDIVNDIVNVVVTMKLGRSSEVFSNSKDARSEALTQLRCISRG
jgi:hypothetical protein